MYVGVIGTGEYEPESYETAYKVGNLIASRGGVVICGGLGGVMEAACKGAKEAGGFSIAILPGFDRSEANPYATFAIATGLQEARNILIVRASDALVAIGGGFGTLSEIGFALKMKKKLVLINSWQCYDKERKFEKSVIFAKNAEEAVEKLFNK